MMVTYLPVKFEFNWSNRFRVRVRKRKYGRTHRQTDVGHINLIGGLVTRNPPKNNVKSKEYKICQTHPHIQYFTGQFGDHQVTVGNTQG